MLSDEEKRRIGTSWQLVAPILDTVVDLFCRRLFEQRPDYRVLFPEDLSGPKKKLAALLESIVGALDWPESAWRDEIAEEDDLFMSMLALGRRHAELQGVADDDYRALGEAFIWTLDYALGEPFDAPCRAAWAQLNSLLAGALRLGRLSGERPAERSLSARPPRSNRPQPTKRGGVLS